ncbi:pyruvate, water dikinase regulatory protein [Alkalihalobacillus macyae]|uniref:pyruvate, water dikinase regulatory protein n=1 Tax=Guptibacillus hwajinpoensis TaxID=208199 RepID=UPI00273B5EBF|nr:pyruvate, water dikinase regulatory protein [Alkalihalobacillus macyae]MDP4552932.1 pyruvate, water dikinase regulatory protein [Alkalihalobacillus macyae]
MTKKETVYVVSDSVGETAELLVKAVATQFFGQEVDIKHFSFVESSQDINNVITAAKYNHSIIAYTIVLEELKLELDQRAQEENVIAVDLMQPLLDAFTKKFDRQPLRQPGQMRKLDEDYFKRVEAIEFAVKYDDGQEVWGLKNADIVLVGVSRTSKTPLSMYLANKQYKVANIPLIPEVPPPEELFNVPRKKCIGLMISPDKLYEIRKERLKSLGLTNSANYASLERIFDEMTSAENIMKRIGCPVIDVSNKAIEETADIILSIIQKRESLI